jgi:hypothetical protein
MELLERYLQAVGKYLPAKGREDMLAEMRANLLAEIEEREDAAGRPLNDGEVAAVLEAHGMPVIVATRYLPQHSLIGPALFPFYWYTLTKSFPLVVLAYTVVSALRVMAEGFTSASLQAAVWHLPGVLLTFWAVVTLGFAVFEYAQGRYVSKLDIPKWTVKDLPPLETGEKRPSLGHGVADLIVSVLTVGWLLAVPTHPYLIIGPGAKLAHGMPFGLTPEWRIFYWQIIGLLVAMWPLKVMMLMPRFARLRQSFDVAVHLLGIMILAVMVQVRSYFVPATTLTMESMKTLAGINAGITFGFKVALLISVLKLAWDLWQMMRGSQHRKAGCAAVF